MIGNFYDESGEPTTALRDTVEALKIAHAEKMEKENEKKRFPPCNSQSKKGEYRRLFCSQKRLNLFRNYKLVTFISIIIIANFSFFFLANFQLAVCFVFQRRNRKIMGWLPSSLFFCSF